jgi:hypothetical protein
VEIFTIIGFFVVLYFLVRLVAVGIPGWFEERRKNQDRWRIMKENHAAGRHWADGLHDLSPAQAAQVRFELESRKREEEARKVHYAPPRSPAHGEDFIGPPERPAWARGGHGVDKDGNEYFWD